MIVVNEGISTQIPMISIAMLTYNHENFIEQAIKSVISQDTIFSYQLIIGEDCSSDNTREIVLKYANIYPDKIIAIFQDFNVGIKTNALSVREYLRGKYIATLEGDDYWTDNHKLQKQVEFLEHHSEYIAVSCNHIDVNEDGKEIVGLKKIILTSGYAYVDIYTLQEAQEYYLSGQTATLVYRNIFNILNDNQIAVYDSCDVIGDKKLNLVLACLGNIFRFKECMSAYRHHDKAWTNRKFVGGMAFYGYVSIKKLERLIFDMFQIEIDFTNGKLRVWYGTVFELIKNFNKENLYAVKHIFNEGDKFKKILYLITHTLTFIYRIKRIL